MIGRWLRRALLPGALGLLATGCVSGGDLVPASLMPGGAAQAKKADGLEPPVRGSEELPKNEALHVCLTVARTMDQAGNDEGALEQWEKVEKLDPSNLEAARRLAVLYDRSSPPDWARAEAEYRRMTKARPNDADLFSDWGYSFYLRNNWDEAEAKMRKALQLNAKHERAHGNLGLVLGQKDRPGDALKEFRAAGLSEAEAHCNLAFVYWSRGKLESAKQECRAARELDASCVKARDMLAMLEAPPHPPAEPGKPGRGATARRPGDGRPRAAALPPEVWEAERTAALRAAAAASAAGSPTMPAPLPEPVLRTSNGTTWVPVNPPAARQPEPSGAGVGSISY